MRRRRIILMALALVALVSGALWHRHATRPRIDPRLVGTWEPIGGWPPPLTLHADGTWNEQSVFLCGTYSTSIREYRTWSMSDDELTLSHSNDLIPRDFSSLWAGDHVVGKLWRWVRYREDLFNGRDVHFRVQTDAHGKITLVGVTPILGNLRKPDRPRSEALPPGAIWETDHANSK